MRLSVLELPLLRRIPPGLRIVLLHNKGYLELEDHPESGIVYTLSLEMDKKNGTPSLKWLRPKSDV